MAGIRKKEGTWSEDVEKYSRQIWLAGLGAYAKIGEDGSSLFDALVQEGEQAEQRVRSEVESVKNGALSRVAEARDKALGKWSALEDAFDKRLSGAITRLGVPSRLELKTLSSQVEVLSRQLEQLNARALPTPAVSEEDEAPVRRRPETRMPAAREKTAETSETAQLPVTTAKPKTRKVPAKATLAKQAKPVEQPEQTVQSAPTATAPTADEAPSEQSVS